MTLSSTRTRTNGLIAVMAAIALLLTAPFAIAALESNPVTGPAMSSFENTAVGQAVSSFSANADAAVTKSQQLRKAYVQAAFFCYAWQCTSYYRTSARWYSAGNLITKFRIVNPRNMSGALHCRSFANMEIRVDRNGGVRSWRTSCG